MICMTETLKYTNTMLTAKYFETGLCSIQGIEDVYKGVIKNKVIAKIDLASALSDCMSADVIKTARPSIIMIAKGLVPRDSLASIIEAYLQADEKFRYGVNILFNECPPDKTFGEYIPIGFARRLLAFRDLIKQSFVGRSEFYICESDGYVYFSFPDVQDYVFNAFPYEVISSAKNWRV